jgi:hypothetical protein
LAGKGFPYVISGGWGPDLVGLVAAGPAVLGVLVALTVAATNRRAEAPEAVAVAAYGPAASTALLRTPWCLPAGPG